MMRSIGHRGRERKHSMCIPNNVSIVSRGSATHALTQGRVTTCMAAKKRSIGSIQRHQESEQRSIKAEQSTQSSHQKNNKTQTEAETEPTNQPTKTHSRSAPYNKYRISQSLLC